MRRFFGLASFALAITIILGNPDEPENILEHIGNRLTLKGDNVEGKVKRCTIETGANITYEVHPNNELPESYATIGKYCKVTAEIIKLDYAGIWTLTTYTDDDKSFSKKFAVTIEQKAQLIPSSAIQVNNAGQWVTAWFPGNDSDVTECKLKATGSEVEYDLMKDDYENINRYRTCGVRMQIDKEKTGQWEFQRKLGKYLIEKSLLHISIGYQNDDPMKVEHLIWNLGAKKTIRIDDSGIIFCQFTKPDGSLSEIKYRSCSIDVNPVTEFHRGIWRANYAIMGKITLNKAEFHVETRDLNSITGRQIPGIGYEINLLCRSGKEFMKFCTFIRPDKSVIHLPIGVGNENYSYYGDGFEKTDNRQYADCGVTIHKPSDIDFGLWSCEMGFSDDYQMSTYIRGTVINVVNTRTKRSYKTDSSQVFVKRGDDFKIRCTINALLDYCWLTSPNGTVYGVLPEVHSPSTLQYDGKGFTMGDCGAIVKRANTSDEGEWTCHLGISGNVEVENKIPVHVTDSYLIPVERTVISSDKTLLSTRIFLPEKGTLQYCRWVRPNGHGINQEDSSRYESFTKMDRCELYIRDVSSEDIGKWTCFAMMVGDRQTEEQATIELTNLIYELKTTNLISIVLGIGLLILTLAGSILAAIYVFKCRKVRTETIKSPPPYNPEDYEIPHAVKTDSNDVTMDKDYRY